MALNQVGDKWRVQVRAPGFQKSGTFETKKLAMEANSAWLALAKASRTGGFVTPVAGATLADLIDRYRQDVPKTWGRSKDMSIELLRRELGDVALSKLTANTLQQWIDKRLKLGTGGVTVAMYLSALSTILQFGKHSRRLAIDANLAKEARAALAYRGVDTRPGERTREPKADELSKLFAYWKDKGSRQKIPMETIVRLALATTMRLSEITGLRLEDIDRVNKTVIIRQRKHPTKQTQNDQVVPLLPDAWLILEPLIDGRMKGRVFNVNSKSASASFTRAVAACGIKDLHFHDTRHSAVGQFFRLGLDIQEVSVLTGHSSWNMLKRYTHIKASDIHNKVAQLAKVKS